MRKKLCSMMLAVGMTNVLAGCASTVNLTDTQTDQVAEYLSSVIVRYDQNDNNNKLVKLEETVEATKAPTLEAIVEPTEKPQATTKPETTTETKPGNGNDTTDKKSEEIDKMKKITFESLYGLNHVSITYKGVKEYKTYPDKGSVDAITADSNHKFIAVTFTLKNTTNKDVSVDLLKKQPNFLLKVNGESWISSAHTLLPNDMMYYQGNLKAGGSKDVVVIFEAKESITLSKATFYAMNKDMKAYEVAIK